MNSERPKVIMVCGKSGAGKTKYSLNLAKEINAIKFSIDTWMLNLFADDIIQPLDYDWLKIRISRCHEQIWSVTEGILKCGGCVILDLGFSARKERTYFINKCLELSISPEIHLLEAPENTRWNRVKQRNLEKDPELYSFEVTKEMFDFVDPLFEQPTVAEAQFIKEIPDN